MAFLGASKFMSVATLLAILLLLINSALGAAAQPKGAGRKLLQNSDPDLPRGYGVYPGGGGYIPSYPSGRGYTRKP
ncbi:unnamed protein product [Sphenostylis stenocarpa]|uniref:Uncharacterized protein n=1 Tax=Sphenostylis stenocarpa TaxID=92480 RepID=A0AA86VQN5_9FABA|nr:unnamed protein product [Sphenostylis stenocarpa]